MFNGFFYNEVEGQTSLQHFIHSIPLNEILLFIDPPFGGLINALKNGVNVIWKLIGGGQ